MANSTPTQLSMSALYSTDNDNCVLCPSPALSTGNPGDLRNLLLDPLNIEQAAIENDIGTATRTDVGHCTPMHAIGDDKSWPAVANELGDQGDSGVADDCGPIGATAALSSAQDGWSPKSDTHALGQLDPQDPELTKIGLIFGDHYAPSFENFMTLPDKLPHSSMDPMDPPVSMAMELPDVIAAGNLLHLCGSQSPVLLRGEHLSQMIEDWDMVSSSREAIAGESCENQGAPDTDLDMSAWVLDELPDFPPSSSLGEPSPMTDEIIPSPGHCTASTGSTPSMIDRAQHDPSSTPSPQPPARHLVASDSIVVKPSGPRKRPTTKRVSKHFIQARGRDWNATRRVIDAFDLQFNGRCPNSDLSDNDDSENPALFTYLNSEIKQVKMSEHLANQILKSLRQERAMLTEMKKAI